METLPFQLREHPKTSHFLCICTYFEKSSPDIFMRRKMILYNMLDPAKKDQKRN